MEDRLFFYEKEGYSCKSSDVSFWEVEATGSHGVAKFIDGADQLGEAQVAADILIHLGPRKIRAPVLEMDVSSPASRFSENLSLANKGNSTQPF